MVKTGYRRGLFRKIAKILKYKQYGRMLPQERRIGEGQ
jgi:hypothetical protein